MYKNLFLRPILLIGFITVLFASCDKDYDELGTDIVGDNHFVFDKTYRTVAAHNQEVGPVASNGLAINPLGIYENPAFGTTKAEFVTQLVLSSTSPVFNNTDPTKFVALPTMDSVVMNIPYFSHVPSNAVITDNVKPYVLDSIYGKAESKFKLSIYRSNYYLRDLDPDQGLEEEQLFFTDNNVIGNNIDYASGVLNNSSNTAENSEFFFNPKEHKTKAIENGEEVFPRSAPSMRLHLDNQFFLDKIIATPTANLSSQSAFKNYFRGLYFQVQSTGNEGNMAMMNFSQGEITLYYKEDKIIPDDPTTTTVNEYQVDRVAKTFVLNLKGNAVSLHENSNMSSAYTSAINPANNTDPNGVEKLYLKGGQGSMAVVEIFGKTDLKGLALNPNYNSNLAVSASNTKYLINPAYNSNLAISDTNPKYVFTGPNGVSDEIDDIRANDWLINEANLTFYIDKDAMQNASAVEPNRIFLYDLNNNKMLTDYSYDNTPSSYPKFNKYIFGGILLDQEGKLVKQKNADGTFSSTRKGTKYKIRITDHVRNLINKDSTNVKFGLVVSESINSVAFAKRKPPITNGATIKSIPAMSVVNPLGTILYGSNPSVPIDKRLKLEIYYTKPKTGTN